MHIIILENTTKINKKWSITETDEVYSHTRRPSITVKHILLFKCNTPLFHKCCLLDYL